MKYINAKSFFYGTLIKEFLVIEKLMFRLEASAFILRGCLFFVVLF